MEDSATLLASRVARELRVSGGIAAITLGGSWAAGTADERSDVDLGLYYEPDYPIDLSELSRLVATIDDRRIEGLVTKLGEWGPWVNGGAWLLVERRRVDIVYRDLERVRQAIEDCRAGRLTHHFQIGHPAGYSQQIYAGEIDVCETLVDPRGVVAALKTLTRPYPSALRRALVEGLWEARFSLDLAQESARRGDVYHVAGCAYRCVARLVEALFGINETYWINEKRALPLADSFALHPADLKKRVERCLGTMGHDPATLAGTLSELRRLVQEVDDLAQTTNNDTSPNAAKAQANNVLEARPSMGTPRRSES